MQNKDLLRQKCLDGAARARKLAGELAAFRSAMLGLAELVEGGRAEIDPEMVPPYSLGLDKETRARWAEFVAGLTGCADAAPVEPMFELAAQLERFALRDLR